MSIPQKLYKYRKFDVTTLNIVTDHGLYYSNPRKFNDPLDCELSIEPNISPRQLADLLKVLYGTDREDDWRYEVSCAIHYAEEEGDIKADGGARDYLKRMLANAIGSEVRKEFDTRGVLSFSATWQSVLMWSHYADEHRGICLEFDTRELPHERLAPVKYEGARSVSASDIYAWKVSGDEEAGRRAFDTHFYSKAPDWRYEQEWRDVGEKLGECGDYRITGIYFGLRCDQAVQVAIVKMLGVDTDIELFDVGISGSSFDLHKTPVDVSEVDALGMREPRGIEIARLAAESDDLTVGNGATEEAG